MNNKQHAQSDKAQVTFHISDIFCLSGLHNLLTAGDISTQCNLDIILTLVSTSPWAPPRSNPAVRKIETGMKTLAMRCSAPLMWLPNHSSASFIYYRLERPGKKFTFPEFPDLSQLWMH